MLTSALLERLATLQSELTTLKTLASAGQDSVQSIQDKSADRRKLNVANSPMNRLPLEMISTIFHCATVPFFPPFTQYNCWGTERLQNLTRRPEDVFLPVTLAAVCSLWREVALSTPLLWTTFEYPLCLCEAKRDFRYLLSLYLHNSRHLPIDISLSFSRENTEQALWHPSFDRALIFNSVRIRSLSLINPPLSWFSQLNNTPSIANLWIEWERPPYTTNRLPLHKCHALSRLSIDNTGLSDVPRILYQVPPSLTVLELRRVQIDTAIKTMLKCPNLVEACIRVHMYSEELPDTREQVGKWFTEPVVFPKLEVFLWDRAMEDHWPDLFFEHIRVPALRTLMLMDTDDGTMPGASIGESYFISHLPSTLKTLKIGRIFDINLATVPGRLLGFDSPLENLCAHKCDNLALTAIFNTLLPSGNNPKSIRIPLLKSLSIDGLFPFDEWELRVSEIEPLVTALEHRLTKGSTFRLELSGFGVDWMPSVQKRLRELIEKGVQLEIVEDMEPVHWLRGQ